MSNLHPRWQQLLGSLVGAHFYGDAKDILVRVLAEHDADENDRLRAAISREETAHLKSLAEANEAEVERDRLRAMVEKREALNDAQEVLVRELDAELKLLRAERDECVALFESYGHDMNWTAKMDALLAKLRTP